MGFITLEEYKNYAEITSTNEDRKLINLIENSTDFIKVYCGLDFTQNTYTEELDLEGRYVFLSQLPVVSVTSVKYYDDTGTLSDAVDAAEYRIFKEEGMLSVSYDLYALIYYSKYTEKQVQVVYQAGYSTIPNSIKQATMDLVKYYQKSEYLPVMSANVRTIDYDVMHSVSLPPHIRRMLSIYRKIE